MDKTLELASSLASKIFEGASSIVANYGTQTVDLVLWTVRIQGLGKFLAGVASLLIALVFWGIFEKAQAVYKACKVGKQGDEEGKQFWMAFTMLLCAGGGLIVLIIAICIFFNIWNYVAVFKPELWLTNEAIKTVLDISPKK